MIEDIFNNPDPKNAKQLEKILIKQFKKLGGDPRFKKLSDHWKHLEIKLNKDSSLLLSLLKNFVKLQKKQYKQRKS